MALEKYLKSKGVENSKFLGKQIKGKLIRLTHTGHGFTKKTEIVMPY